MGEHSGTIALGAGVRYAIRLELVENTGDADARLYWSSPTQAREVVPRPQIFPADFIPMSTPTVTPSPSADVAAGTGSITDHSPIVGWPKQQSDSWLCRDNLKRWN